MMSDLNQDNAEISIENLTFKTSDLSELSLVKNLLKIYFEDQLADYSNEVAAKEEIQAIFNSDKALKLSEDKSSEPLSESTLSQTPILHRLKEMFELDQLSYLMLLFALLVEVDHRYLKVYAYMQGSWQRQWPTVGFISELLSYTFPDVPRDVVISSFYEDGPIWKYRLLEKTKVHDRAFSFYLSLRTLKYILSLPAIDESIEDGFQMVNEEINSKLFVEPRYAPKEFKKHFKNYLLKQDAAFGRPYFFVGPAGSGKKSLATYLCTKEGVPLAVMDCRYLLNLPNAFEKIMLIFRECIFHKCALYLDNFDALCDHSSANDLTLRHIFYWTCNYNFLVFIGSQQAEIKEYESVLYKVTFEKPNSKLNQEIWKSCLKPFKIKEADIAKLNQHFKLSGKEIYNFVCQVTSKRKTVTLNHFLQHSPQQAHPTSLKSMQKMNANTQLSDLALTNEQKEHASEIIDYIKSYTLIEGFCEKHALMQMNKGVSALFCGPSGVGKSILAGAIANEVNINAYRIELSSVVSKYIGETEKNLSEIFKFAEANTCILFFDEADALFGKRTNVKDAHDRYANLETNYLLQSIEQFSGICILASNFRSNIDNAFLRRMQFIVEFCVPDKDQRRLIWEKMLSHSSFEHQDIDFSFLAERLPVSGGHIKNIVVMAQFYALRANSPLTMQHIIRAVKRELAKISKAFIAEDFEPYT